MNKLETQKRVSQIVDYNKKPCKPRIKYFSRLNVFKKSNLIFNPETMLAVSYKWYNILQVINGKVYLNNYSYSISTIKQYYLLSHLLDQLKIEYKTLESPLGLQNLNSSVKHYVNELAKLTVLNKFGRKKRNLAAPQKKLIELAALGFISGKNDLTTAIEFHESLRNSRLLREQKSRIDKKVIALAGNDAIL